MKTAPRVPSELPETALPKDEYVAKLTTPATINDNPSMESYSSVYVNDIHIIAQHDNLMSVNTAIETDLYGQVNAEFIKGHRYSRSRGQFDFVKGASFSKGGKSFIGLKSAAKKRHHLLHCAARADGYRYQNRFAREVHKERAQALISIAHPNFRDELTAYAKSVVLV